MAGSEETLILLWNALWGSNVAWCVKLESALLAVIMAMSRTGAD